MAFIIPAWQTIYSSDNIARQEIKQMAFMWFRMSLETMHTKGSGTINISGVET